MVDADLSISRDAIDFIAGHEAFRAQIYIDEAGHPTIGYGHKVLPGESYPDGIAHDEALRLLQGDVQVAETAIQNNVKVDITQAQFDALVSFVFNVGSEHP